MALMRTMAGLLLGGGVLAVTVADAPDLLRPWKTFRARSAGSAARAAPESGR